MLLDSNLNLNIEVCQCFMAGFYVWLENFSNNAAKTLYFCKLFFVKVKLEINYSLNFYILLLFYRYEFCKSLSRY